MPSFRKRHTYYIFFVRKRFETETDTSQRLQGCGDRYRSTYLATEAVSNTANPLNTQLLPQVLDGRLDDRVDMGGLVLREPSLKVDLAGLEVLDLDRIALEEIRDDSQVALGGELVRDELAVGVDAEDIAQDEDGLLGVLVVLGVGEVSLNWKRKET